MSPSQQQLFRHLLPSLAIALVMIVIGAALLGLSRQELKTARLAQQNDNAQATALRDRYNTTARDEAAIRQTIQRYAHLQRNGLTRGEDRLAWADALREARESLRIPRLDYELLPQRTLRNLGSGNDYRLQASRMKIDMALLHEGDLLRVIDALQSRQDALIVLRRCSIDREELTAPGARNSHTLKAGCELDWISLQVPEPVAGQAPRKP